MLISGVKGLKLTELGIIKLQNSQGKSIRVRVHVTACNLSYCLCFDPVMATQIN